MSDDSIVASKLDFVKTTLDPYSYQVVPPNIHNYTTIVKELTVYGNNTIVNAAGPVSETTGVVTWFVQRGVGSVVRWGRVPSGSAHTYVASPPWFGTLSTGNLTYTLSDTLWVPYDRDAQVTISPSLTDQFSFVRPFAGQVSLYSSTISTTNASLSGTLAITTLTDFRDAFIAGTGLEVTTLVQQAVTKKDGLANIPVYDGVTSILGSDIPTDFASPDPNLTVNYRDGIAGPGVVTVLTNTPFGSGLGPGGELCCASYFFTPYNFSSVTSGCAPRAGPINSTIIQSGIPSPFMDNVPWIELAFPLNNQAPAWLAPPTRGFISYRALTFNVYANCVGGRTVGSNLNYTYSRAKYMTLIRSLSASNESEYNVISELCDDFRALGSGLETAEPLPAITTAMNQSQGGIYVGTHVYVYIANEADQELTNPNVLMPTCRVRMHSRSLYTQGNLGPVRVIRYDSLEPGQTVNVSGRILAECVPTGILAPYVTPSSLTDKMSMAVGLLPFISMLYNGKSPFRRNWTRSEYMRLCEAVVPTLNVANLLQWEDVPEEVVRAAQAAGLFDTLGGIGGAMLGGRFGNPALGQALGSALGGALGSKLGFGAGMFGSGSASQIAQARADYGHSAGMYGAESAGMYAAGQYPLSSASTPLKRIRRI